jgi:hypothetical protein
MLQCGNICVYGTAPVTVKHFFAVQQKCRIGYRQVTGGGADAEKNLPSLARRALSKPSGNARL